MFSKEKQIGIFTSVLNMPLFLLGSMVGVLYLEHIYHYNIVEGSSITGMLYLCMLLGYPIFGYIAGITKYKLEMLALGAFFYLTSILLLIYFQHFSKTWLFLIFFFIGFGVSAQNISFSLIENFNNKDEVSIAEALNSILIMLGGAVFQPLLGAILHFYWEGGLVNKVQVFSHAAYGKAFLLMPISIILTTPLLFMRTLTTKPAKVKLYLKSS